MSTAVEFLKAEAGKQTAFGSVATPDFQVPLVGEYMNVPDVHEADFDAGTWTPTELAVLVASHATFTLNGSMLFELLPVFLSGGFGDLTPGGAGPYDYDDEVSPTAVGAPSPYTFLFGGNENIGGTGPAIRIQDAYLQNMVLSSSMNAKQVAMRSNWFGLDVDDNSQAGFAFQDAAKPSPLGLMVGPLGALDIQDADTTGGDFATMTAFDCSLLEWSLNIDTGARPKWALDENQLTICGVRFQRPAVSFSCTLRTNATNVPLVWGAAEALTYQEVQHTINGANSRQVKWQMTGRWQPDFSIHNRSNGEVVMSPTFVCRTPSTQVTTPHFFGWELDTQWSHS